MVNDLDTRAHATVAQVIKSIKDYLTKIGVKHIIYESCNDDEAGAAKKDCSISVVFSLREGD
jgi:hypothetical protein